MRLAVVVLLACAVLRAGSLAPEADRQLAHDIYKELIEIKTGYTTGATTPAAEAMAERLRNAGFPDADIFVGGAIPSKANLVVRYHGNGAEKPLLLLAHTDVVEAKPEDWSMDPFILHEQDGYFYGRGAFDDKAQAALWIANLIRLRQANFHPTRDIIVALTADEEGGGPYNGVAWLLKNRPELIQAGLCLNEGGWGELVNGKRLANDIEVAEKYVVNFRLEVHNKGGHSSLPVADNAIYHLAAALDRLAHFGFPLQTNDVTRAWLKQMEGIQTGAMRDSFAHAAGGSEAALEQIAAAAPMWNAMLRTTCVATQLEGGHARNALPQLAAAKVNCRILPEETIEHVQQTLGKLFNDDQVAISVSGEASYGPASPLNPALLNVIHQVTDSIWPGMPVVPIMVPYATDGKYLRSAGIPTYGVQGLFVDQNDSRMHGRDERMPVQSFYEAETFLYDLVKKLSSQ